MYSLHVKIRRQKQDTSSFTLIVDKEETEHRYQLFREFKAILDRPEPQIAHSSGLQKYICKTY